MNHLFPTRGLIAVFLMTCIHGCTNNASYLLKFYAVQQPSPNSFFVCHGYSCRYKDEIQFSQTDWHEIEAIFAKPTATEAAERLQVAQAIALFEQQVGKISGLSEDRPKSPAFIHPYGQQDCIDETVNTTTYLRILQAANLIKQHRLSEPVHRGYLIDGKWPHNSASIEELASGQRYVIDSWPGANGELPKIETLEQWFSGR